ncbi:prominin-1-A [Diachasma alloeum]|uniref:prominin-1-A n=1 Tax=Diachasma alloeum TaxID=454923 RepID=UPI0007381AE3|nr:prominin-1-A [Diachasma alloeum]
MAHLLGEKQLFSVDFLHEFLTAIQPYDIPLDLLRDAVEGRITASKLISESMHMEVGFLSLLGVCCILACVIPGTELWLACRPIRDYKPSQHPGFLAFLLSILVLLLGIGISGMIISNEAANIGISKIPIVVETAIEDFRDYHTGTTGHIRKCLTRSLDVASEAIMADLDNVEELLGKPVQVDLATETGLEIALAIFFQVSNTSQELSSRAKTILKEGERARELGAGLSREADGLRRELESLAAGCAPQDRPLCATINPAGLTVSLRLERLLRDERLLRLREVSQDNLTEAGRQARGEYLYVPHYIARRTLEARNYIRREINSARTRIFEEARSIESTSAELNGQLKTVRKIANYVVPYIEAFEEVRWLVGIGAVIGVLLVWILLMAALICRCGSTEGKIRPTLLCAAVVSCLASIGLWGVVIGALGISSHTEMLVCRPLEDPNYRTLETILESKLFLGQPLAMPLNELLQKCEQDEAVYPAFPLGKTSNLEQLADYWMWPGLSKAFSLLKVDLKGFKILTPSLEGKLESLLYACRPNLTEHKIMIRGPIVSQDMITMSNQIYNVGNQLSDMRSSKAFMGISTAMQSLIVKKVRPLIEIQDNLIDQLTTLEMQLQPFYRKANQTLVHLRAVQSYIDDQGDVIAQMKTKSYVERLTGYLDQWRTHVFNEMRAGVTKCRPLWDIANGIKLLMCQHVLGPLNGCWFLTVLCILIMMLSTPVAHTLASVYRRDSKKIDAFQSGIITPPDTQSINRDTWRTPPPPPPQGNWVTI